jgi:hypothetical protein
MPLNTRPNIDDTDGFYQRLVELHHDRSEEQSRLINTCLILLLANHIGESAVLEEAMRIAAETADQP